MSKVRLGDVAFEHKETCKGNKSNLPVVGLEHLVPEEITLSAWDEGSDNTFTKVFRKGNVLFGRRRAYLKKAAVAPFDGICSGDITVIEANADRIVPELLPFIIQNDALFDFAVEKSAGSLSPRVKWEHLREFEFELPEMGKQKQLAEVLWSIDTTKKAYQNLIKSTDELVKSQFIEMFGSGNFPCIPFAEAYKLQMGKTPTREVTRYWNSPDYRWISIADLSSYRKFTAGTKEYISQAAVDEMGMKKVPKDTVLMSFKLSIGKTAITSEDIYTNEAIMAFVPKQSKILNSFLQSYLDFKDWTEEGKQAVKGVTLNKESIGNASIIVPPLELQEQFAAFVRQSDKSKFELEQSLAELTATYKRIISENLG